jgi:uncharacterized protein (TIGR03790 family)
MSIFPGRFRMGASARRLATAILAVSEFVCASARAESTPPGPRLSERVVLVANGADPDSEAIARHYAAVRGVPPANIITLSMPLTETVTWKEFVASIWGPLETALVAKGWIDAIPMDVFDEVGRREYAVSGQRIAALVLCRGVPLKIANDPTLFKDVGALTEHPELRTNQGAVDSELSLLAQTNYPINANISNPLFGNASPTDYVRQQVVKVSRLDGPTASDAMHLVDLAVEAERTGLVGRAYLDISGPRESGNSWLEHTAPTIQGLGFDITVNHGPGTFPVSSRFDAPALYFGWYTSNLNGPFTLPGFRFPPGAIAVHIHSFSAATLRSATEGWCGPLIAHGATATVGNVFEPYLEFVHRPDLLMAALARGDDLVDAAYYALPALSWQSIVIGDPLYRPFLVPLAAQVRSLPTLPPQLAGYVVIREMNLLDAQGKKPEAVQVGKAGMKQFPSLVLGLALARRLEGLGSVDEATWVAQEAAEGAEVTPANWELIGEAASLVSANKNSAEAIDLYRKLFEADAIPRQARLAWLADARDVALRGGDTGQAAEWKEEMDQTGEKPGGTLP